MLCNISIVVVVGASEHQSGDMMKFVFQIDLSVIAALISSMLSPVSLFKTSISVVFGRPLYEALLAPKKSVNQQVLCDERRVQRV